jgi:hypothetical protein
MTAPTQPQPAPVQPAKRNGWLWTARLLARWLRPKAIAALILVLAAMLKAVVAFVRSLRNPKVWQALGSSIGPMLSRIHGWWLWQWRAIKTDRDRRLAIGVMLGSFIIPLLLFIGLAHLLQRDDTQNILDTAEMDESVAAPDPATIIAVPEEDLADAPTVVVIEPPPAPTAPQTTSPAAPEPLSAKNFSFELFAKREENGQLKLLSHVAQHYMLQWYPLGTPANQLMRFFGAVMERSKGSALNVAKDHCLNMNVGKAFTARTVSCTYSHQLPMPLAGRESEKDRVFWIMALSFDRKGNLTDLRLHARLTRAPS